MHVWQNEHHPSDNQAEVYYQPEVMSNRGSPAPRRPVETLVSSNSVSSDLSDTRKRQSKRDEVMLHSSFIGINLTLVSCQAIRKKIENELNRKRPGSAARRGPQQQSSKRGGGGGKSDKRAAGTVSALRPLPALTVPSSITVADASQLCAAKRTDCVLVVDEDEHLCGIFTAKDLAFRVCFRSDLAFMPFADVLAYRSLAKV